MGNTSATGGYLNQPVSPALPGNLTFQQFLQTVMVGVSGLDGTLVRPNWQRNPPKPPQIDVQWMAFGYSQGNADQNPVTVMADDGQTQTMQRNEEIQINCSFYGDDAYDLASLVRDGFYLPQNLEALTLAKMGMVSATQALRVPDLVNEEWRDRITMTITLRRLVLRAYPTLSFASANGTVTTILGTEPYLVAWTSGEGET